MDIFFTFTFFSLANHSPERWIQIDTIYERTFDKTTVQKYKNLLTASQFKFFYQANFSIKVSLDQAKYDMKQCQNMYIQIKKQYKGQKKTHQPVFRQFQILMLLTVLWCNPKKSNPKQTLELLKQTYFKPRVTITEHVRYYYRYIPYRRAHIY